MEEGAKPLRPCPSIEQGSTRTTSDVRLCSLVIVQAVLALGCACDALPCLALDSPLHVLLIVRLAESRKLLLRSIPMTVSRRYRQPRKVQYEGIVPVSQDLPDSCALPHPCC